MTTKYENFIKDLWNISLTSAVNAGGGGGGSHFVFFSQRVLDVLLIYTIYYFCRPDGVNTVTVDEKERFEEIKDRLRAYLSSQITHFRYVNVMLSRDRNVVVLVLTVYTTDRLFKSPKG